MGVRGKRRVIKASRVTLTLMGRTSPIKASREAKARVANMASTVVVMVVMMDIMVMGKPRVAKVVKVASTVNVTKANRAENPRVTNPTKDIMAKDITARKRNVPLIIC